MKHFILSFIFILVAVQVFPQKENNSLDSLMSSIFPDDRPGAVIAIVKKGKVAFKKGYGIADLDNTDNWSFCICCSRNLYISLVVILEKPKYCPVLGLSSID